MKITNYKSQITNKSQITTYKLQIPATRIPRSKAPLIKSFCGGSRGAVFSKRAPLLLEIFILFLLLLLPSLIFSQTVERFPKPDFQTGYQRPSLITPMPRAALLEYLDVFVLVLCLSLASFFALKLRSRRKIFLLMVFCLVYFGFYRKGCVCSIGATQNVFYALFNTGYIIPFTVAAFFILPLIFTLFFGRTFCAAVCPLGAIQDAVVLKPARVPAWLAAVLGIIPYIYLGLAVLFAAVGAGFIICQYDPFVGFFRFGAGFNMVILGISMLILGTVIARPYCRFFCPYGVLLDWMSRLAKRHVKITPDECNNCRLCEESCPFGAIKKPGDMSLPGEKKETEIKRLAILLVLLPVIVIGSGWVFSRLYIPLSRQHFIVSLAEEIHLENSGQRKETTEQTRAFRGSGKPTEELFSEAAVIRNKFKTGTWILGGFLGFIICLKIIGLSLRKKQVEYEIDTGTCLSCGRCFKYCPYEQVRLGIISPDEIEPPASEINQKFLRGVQGPTAWGGEAGAFAPSRESLNCDSQLPARCSVLEPLLRAKSQELRANLKRPPGCRRQ